MSLTFETRVAAAAVAQSPKLVRQEFTRVLRVSAKSTERNRRRLAFREVLYFKLKAALEAEGVQMSPEDKRDLYQVLVSKQAELGPWRRKGRRLERGGEVPVTLDLTKIMRSTQAALRAYQREGSLIERRAEVCSGELVFQGTRVPVRQVVEQFRAGVPASEITEDLSLPSRWLKPTLRPA